MGCHMSKPPRPDCNEDIFARKHDRHPCDKVPCNNKIPISLDFAYQKRVEHYIKHKEVPIQIGPFTNNFTSSVMNQHKTDTEQTLAKIAATRELSGQDGATMINANQLDSQIATIIATMTQQVQNENTRIGMPQIADGALQGVQAQNAYMNSQLHTIRSTQ